ncbi:ABC transporter ATP-binding protein [candidate division TA06 bacterium]|uniref:ABC transporter ATP-binding protein n=1 Tax=candidate division TA06 bacterium TaxID=2250710 RepID=A0A523UW13_UNCT6|nr:MAG: ABC transporter ATP-binding protein [candidate division TA06 bacterium]
MKRLLGYTKPYKRLIAFAVLLLLFATAFDLSLPYISKVTIDRYIIPYARMLTLAGRDSELEKKILTDYSGTLIKIEGNRYMVQSTSFKDYDRRDLKRLERDDYLMPKRYYMLSENETKGDILAIIEEHSDLFHTAEGYRYIALDDMSKIPGKELWVLRSSDLKGVRFMAMLFLGILILSFLSNFSQVYLIQYTGQKFMFDLRMRLFSHLQTLSVSFFDKNPVGRLVTRVSNDVEVLSEMFSSVLITFFKDIFMLVGIVIILLRLNVRLALVSFTLIPLIVYVTMYFRIKARDAFRSVRLRLAKINVSLQENISGMRVVQMFVREKENYKRFSRINHDYFLANMRQIVIFATFRPLIEIISASAVALIIWYGGGQVIMEAISLGTLVAFLSYVQMFFRPIRDLSEKFNTLQAAMASSERIFLLMDTKNTILEPGEPVELGKIDGKVEFKNVWFSYDTEYVLRDVTFEVRPGESVAIVGATGAGKTSIINLLERFYEVKKGTILIDGVDIRKMRKSDLRSNIGLVMQDVFLFAGDIQGNVRLGNSSISDEKVRRATEYANASGFIKKLDGGYSAEVKERGVTLSAGQRQLLSFARALAFDPSILVLDEATSNIDTETEVLIQDALQRLMKGRTSIIIAHRLSTIQRVNRIIVLHKGEIVEEGTHQELLKKRGIYYRLYQLQYKK